MPGLTFTNNNTQWVLCLDGSVSKMVSGKETPNQGQWSSDLLANSINLTIPGGTNFSVPVKCSFNASNQLVVVVPGGGSAAATPARAAAPAAASPSATATPASPTGASASSGVGNVSAGTAAASASGGATANGATKPAAPSAGAAADSAPYTFEGSIDISDNREVRYNLVDPNGNPQSDSSGNAIALLVHGDLSINGQLDHLVITFPDKSTTFITGSAPDGSGVTPGSNPNDTTGSASDQLSFAAITNNSSGKAPANIIFLGLWNVNTDGIVFQASGTTGQQTSLLLGGSYKGITAGIAIHQQGNTTDAAFVIQGTHQFKAPDGSGTNVNWSVGLGYSNKQIDATVNFAASSIPANASGNSLTLNGSLQFVSGPSQQVALALNATYDTRADGQLVFSADFSDGPSGPAYTLGLQGKYTVKGGQVTFDISVDGSGAGTSVKVDLGYMSTDGKLNAHIQAVLSKTPSGNTQVSFDFELTMQIVNGVLVPAGDPVPLPASGSSSGGTASSSTTTQPVHPATPASPHS